MNNIIKSRKVLQVNGKKEVGKMETTLVRFRGAIARYVEVTQRQLRE